MYLIVGAVGVFIGFALASALAGLGDPTDAFREPGESEDAGW